MGQAHTILLPALFSQLPGSVERRDILCQEPAEASAFQLWGGDSFRSWGESCPLSAMDHGGLVGGFPLNFVWRTRGQSLECSGTQRHPAWERSNALRAEATAVTKHS